MRRFHKIEQNLYILIGRLYDIHSSFKKNFTHSPLLCEFPIYLLYENNIASASKLSQCLFFQKKMCIHNGRIHLPHLRIRKYFMDESAINFCTRFFFILCAKIWQKIKKNHVQKFTDESSIKYLWIRK